MLCLYNSGWKKISLAILKSVEFEAQLTLAQRKRMYLKDETLKGFK